MVNAIGRQHYILLMTTPVSSFVLSLL